MGKKKANGHVTYKSYLWVEKDPIIDALRTAVSDSRKSYSEIHQASGVTVGTLNNWFYRNTRRPQFSTVAAVALACGKRHIRFYNGKPYLE